MEKNLWVKMVIYITLVSRDAEVQCSAYRRDNYFVAIFLTTNM